MSMFELINPHLKGNLLVNSNQEIPLIKLPVGCIASRKHMNSYSFIYSKESNIEKLIANSKDNSESIELLPVYCALDHVILEGKKIEINIRGVINDEDTHIVNSIIEGTHYLRPPYKGLTIVAEFKNKNDKGSILRECEKSQNEYSIFEKIIADCSNIAGCAIIDYMTYANPSGRIEIAREMNCEDLLTDETNKKSRDEILKLLKVAWVSRFAVSKLYQGIGIGTVLAKHVAIVAANKMIPKANYVEVFTNHPIEMAKEILESQEKSFLKKAGYKVYNKLLDSKPVYNSSENDFSTYRKLYFYKKVDE